MLLLCSDGLTEHVLDEEIAEVVGGPDDPDAICDELVGLANARGGEDNSTVALVRCQ
jgi:protein phosphatase